jgi:hypothetical protein
MSDESGRSFADFVKRYIADRPSPPPEESEVPMYVEPVIAWRAWKIDAPLPWTPADAMEPRLRPIGIRGVSWPPGEAMVATCEKPPILSFRMGGPRGLIAEGPVIAEARHSAPVLTCSCGVWALRTREDVERLISHRPGPLAYGRVKLWGRIVECERGFRAEYAYPADLIVAAPFEEMARPLASSLGRLYRVPSSWEERKTSYSLLYWPPSSNAAASSFGSSARAAAEAMLKMQQAFAAGAVSMAEIRRSLDLPDITLHRAGPLPGPPLGLQVSAVFVDEASPHVDGGESPGDERGEGEPDTGVPGDE